MKIILLLLYSALMTFLGVISLLLFIYALSLACKRAAHSAPPAGADPSLAPFFRSLQRPDHPGSCCDMSDCRPVRTRVVNGEEQVFIDPASFPGGTGNWIPVPDSKRLAPQENPTGEPIACWTPGMGLLCFLQGTGI